MHFSDFSRSSDSSGSREARASMVRLLSYWQYYHRKISPSLESFILLWSQGFHLSSIIKSSPSSSHYHHVITIIIKSTSPYHHVITIIITSSPPVSKDHIYHRISRKRLHQLKKFSITIIIKLSSHCRQDIFTQCLQRSRATSPVISFRQFKGNLKVI